MTFPRCALLLPLLSLLAVSQALASDGVLEINQVCALAGCFPGDSAGFPVEISQSGSYALTSNLDLSSEPSPPDATAIAIGADDVAIDLRGFAIIGTTACDFLGACTNTGSGIGIRQSGGIRERTSVRDGVIRGMGRYGIYCDIGCSVENVKLQGNGDIGIYVVNAPARIQGNLVRNNGGIGIHAAGVISENVIENNGGVGLRDGGLGSAGRSVIARNRVSGNSGGGATCSYSTVVDNVLAFNSNFDLRIDSGAVCALGRNTISGTLDNSVGAFVEVDGNLCGIDSVCP